MTDLERWTESVGELPYKVTVYENAARKEILYLRWRGRDAKGVPNWLVESLGKKLRTENGRIVAATQEWARAQANEKYAELLLGLPADQRPVAPVAPLTILQALELACDKETGCYPKDSPHRREVSRELRHASRILGERLPFNAIRKTHLVKLWRNRHAELAAKGEVGARGAEVTVARLLAIAEWLRDDNRIDEVACKAWKDWKSQMRTEAGAPDPYRPRHTREDALAIMAVADQVDPRLGLAMAIGAELRGGQVVRCRRSDLTLEVDSESWGTCRVGGRGKKRGTVVHLTRKQREAVDRALAGYLAPLESMAIDYPLFPAGKLAGRKAVGGETKGGVRRGYTMEGSELHARPEQAEAAPIGASILDDWFREAEQLAGVEHVPGRSWYGLRRVFLDKAVEEGLSKEALMEHGGWADTQVPEQIYRNKVKTKAGREARDARSRYRGEE